MSVVRQRIAIIGSAPSSAGLAPYDDDSWDIWGTSPGAVPHVKRVSAWFELHAPGERPDWPLSFEKFLTSIPKERPCYMIEPVPWVPASVAYPKKEMVDLFGPYFFTSSIAWMLALAITRKPREIGLWGVDMAQGTEYADQRSACHFFLELARAQGIKITVPKESMLLAPPPLYGFCRADPVWARHEARRVELVLRIAEHERLRDEHARNAAYLSAILDEHVLHMSMSGEAAQYARDAAPAPRIVEFTRAKLGDSPVR